MMNDRNQHVPGKSIGFGTPIAKKRPWCVFLIAGVIAFGSSGCQVIFPTSKGYAAAALLTNAKRISVTKNGGTIDRPNVSVPAGTILTGAAPFALKP